MKLQDLDKTKRYDLSECTDEELLCVLNWLKCNDTGWEEYDTKVLVDSELEFESRSWTCEYITDESIKPTFIQDDKFEKLIILNKQYQFINELQQLCKKYDADILFTDTEIRQSTRITVQIETKNI